MSETGSKTTGAARHTVLSIQPRLNGLSFVLLGENGSVEAAGQAAVGSAMGLPELWRRAVGTYPVLEAVYDRVIVVVDTARCCIVPEDLFETRSAEAWFRLHGFDLSDAECLVCSLPVGGTVAIMALAADDAAWLEKRFGETLCYASPLQSNMSKKHSMPTVEINVGHDSVCVSVWRDGFVLAETLPMRNTADVLFYLMQLDKAWIERNTQFLVTGFYSSELLRELRRMFRRVTTDDELCKRPGASRIGQVAQFNNVIYLGDAYYQR